MKYMSRTLPIMLAALLISGLWLTSCSSESKAGSANHVFAMASTSDMPIDVQKAPVAVTEAYRFAVANPDVLRNIPCYCGCGAMGHTSNYACYVTGTDDDGAVIYDNHALGCSICVDISQDVMRKLNQGKDVSEIFTYIESSYARYGPPTPLEG